MASTFLLKFLVIYVRFVSEFRYFQVDLDSNGYINTSELQEALNAVNIKLPGYKVRQLIEKHDTIVKDDKLDLEEFKRV